LEPPPGEQRTINSVKFKMSGSDGMADGQPQYSYLIVGAGVFGVSTAYHLIKKFPDASVTIVDRDAYDAV
jgi:hypothetical protein